MCGAPRMCAAFLASCAALSIREMGFPAQIRHSEGLLREESFLSEATATLSPAQTAGRTTFSILAAISFCHLLNDMMQSLLPALYPMLKSSYALSFGQIGLLTFTYQITASLLQPIIGMFTDRSPRPYSLVGGDGIHPGRAADAGLRRKFRPAAARGGSGGHRLLGISPRVFAGGPHGLRRPTRARAVGIPGRRKRGLGYRPAAGGLHCAAAGAVERRLVLAPRRCWACSCCSTSAIGTRRTAVARLKPRTADGKAEAAPQSQAGDHRHCACCWR